MQGVFCVLSILHTEKFTIEARWENVTLHVAAQDFKLDFGFGPQPVLSSTGLL